MNKSPKQSHSVEAGSAEANRLAIAILEVLAGIYTPAEAAEALGISLPRYYQLETRAVNALVVACEPKPKGKQPSLEGKIATLERELERSQRECARQQALVRLAQRNVGLKVKPTVATKPSSGKKRQRKRTPTIRAMKAVATLQKAARQENSETVQQATGDVVLTSKAPAQRTD
jgi:hypothetical protein